MGKIEDLMVYTKLVLLVIISVVLIRHSHSDWHSFSQALAEDAKHSPTFPILIVASITFVAYEGFQLVINAVNEMSRPEKNIPKAIYSAIALAMLIYIVIASAALFAIPNEAIAQNKEYALAIGSKNAIGQWGANLVILGAILASSSAISGTIFGSSRQMAVIARDGYFPQWLSLRKGRIPRNAIFFIALMACFLILIGGLELILEFGSITFLLVSLLMAIANHKIRKRTQSSSLLTLLAMGGLSLGTCLILYYELSKEWEQMSFIAGLYIVLATGAWFYAKRGKQKVKT